MQTPRPEHSIPAWELAAARQKTALHAKHALNVYETSPAMSPWLMKWLQLTQMPKRDWFKWWPVNVDTEHGLPVGEVLGCPNMRGVIVATNGIDALVMRSDDVGLICHFRNFICDAPELQGPVNRCLMPFAMWRAANKVWHNPALKSKTNKPKAERQVKMEEEYV